MNTNNSDKSPKSNSVQPEKRPSDSQVDYSLVPQTGVLGRKGEPISIAEEVALEQSMNITDSGTEDNLFCGDLSIWNELQQLSIHELITEARKTGIEADLTSDSPDKIRQSVIFRIIKQRLRKSGEMFGEGTLELLPNEFGFLRNPENDYISNADDIYVSPSQVRRFGMRTGTTISGSIRPPKENEKYFALLRVEAINHKHPASQRNRPHFDKMTPILPDRRIVFESNDLTVRIIGHLIPIGFGQRGLIVYQSHEEKTELLRQIAESAALCNPELHVFVILIGDDMQENMETAKLLQRSGCETVSATEDRIIGVTELVLEKAKRMVEYGNDVLIILDSITRLTTALQKENENTHLNKNGHASESQVDFHAVAEAKRFFTFAKHFQEGGSLTVIATVSLGESDPLVKSIADRFQGTGNFEIYLDHTLAPYNLGSTINLKRSGTGSAESLFSPEEYQSALSTHKIIDSMKSNEILEYLAGEIANQVGQ